MRKTKYRWFWVWDFEKEEKWLNEMSAKGLQLVSVGFCTYVFEEGQPHEYTVRMQFLDNWPSSLESTQYIKFIEETGAEYLGAFNRWVYFRKKTECGTFDLLSDIDSRLKPLNNLLLIFGILSISQLCILFSNIIHLISDQHLINERIAIVSLVCFSSFLVTFAFCRIWFIKRKLKRDRHLHE